MDLVLHPRRIDHQPGVMAVRDTRYEDIAAGPIDLDISDPRRPGRLFAGEFAMNVQRVGEPAAVKNIAVCDRAASD